MNDNKVENKTDFINEYIVPILNIEGFDNVTNFLFESEYIINILNLTEDLLIRDTKFNDIFYQFKPLIMEYPVAIFRLIYEILKALRNRDRTIDVVEKFFFENKDNKIINDLRDILISKEVRKALIEVFPVNTERGEVIKEELFKEYDFVYEFFYLVSDGGIIKEIANLFRYYTNNTYIMIAVPQMFDLIYNIRPQYAKDILNTGSRILIRLIRQESVDNFITVKLTDYLNAFFFGEEFNKYDVSGNCKNFMHRVFFEDISDLANEIKGNSTLSTDAIKNNLMDMRYFYIEKIIIHSTKNANDFLTFENCLDKIFDNTIFEGFNLNFTLQSVYVISIFDDIVNKSHFIDSILYEKYDYLISYCLPYGKYKEGEEEKEICTKDDYGNIAKIFSELSHNMKNSTVDSINIYDRTIKRKDYFIGTISLLLLLIPIIIKIFLLIYGQIFFKLNNQKEDINELIYDEDKVDINTKSYINKKKNEKKKLDFPNWYKYLNEYFNIIKNGSELFNSNIKETLYNNVNGITYVKGLLGVSMILYIFGQTYLTLYNLPFKVFTITEFNQTVRNPLYLILLISLRYSPRVILSCSGYTLMYIFLCFIEQEQSFYLPKFYLLQSYKYILLIIVVIFMRYSVYYLNFIFTQERRPMLEILKYILEYSYDNSFRIFFSFIFSDFLGDFTFQWRQNLIHYFYVPINEVFLFIVCTLFISAGYKFKLRIDIILIIIALIIFITKILLFVFYMYDNQKYPTLFYYLYDYGALMLNPIYNMPSFLIGMFFGIINYSIQRGVSLNITSNYQRIFSVENNQQSFALDKKEEEQKEELLKMPTMIQGNFNSEGIELVNLNLTNSKNVYYQQQEDEMNENNRSLTFLEENSKSYKKKAKKKKAPKNTQSFIIDRSETNIGELDPRIKEMPFLIWPTKFLNFHRHNEGKWYFKLIIFLFVIFILLFSCAQFIVVGKYCNIDDKDGKDETMEKLSLQKVISNYTLNFIYVIDIDLVVFMINWIFFILYSKGYKTAEIYDFFNNSFWSFFIKCYFSFIIIASPIILCIFYQCETVIKYTLINVIIFSFIYIIIIFIAVIAFYSLYEMPLKKIFKSFFKSGAILDENTEDETGDYYEMEEQTS